MLAILPILERVFAAVLRVSWQAAALALIVLVAQLLFGRWMSPRGRHALWLLVALRLALPALPSAPWSVFNLTPNVKDAKPPSGVAASSAPQTDGPTIKVIYGPIPNGVKATQPPPPVEEAIIPARTVETPHRNSVFAMLAVAWLVVCSLLVIRLLVRGWRFARRVRGFEAVADANLIELLQESRQRMKVRNPVALRWGENLPGPALTGIFHPKILLPREICSQLSDDEIRFVFMHELAHLKRRDILIDWVIAMLQAMHWFNPFVWYAMHRRRAERELLCDAQVLSICGRGQRRRYGGTIVKLVEKLGPAQRSPIAVGIVENKRQLTRRITMIAQFRRTSLTRSLLAAAVVVIVALVALTDARSDEPRAAELPHKDAPPSNPATTAPLADATNEHHPVAAAPSANDVAVRAMLDRKLPELNFPAVGFTDVIDFLRDVSGANIFVNWRTLEGAGIDRNSPVTARLHDVKFAKALQTILYDVGGGTVKLGYTIDEGVITISTEEDLSKNTATIVYDMRDLLAIPEDIRPRQATSSAATTQPARAQLVDGFIKLITTVVAPDSWREAGGTVGSISEVQGQFIITQTSENHRQIVQLLDQMRESKGLQIRVEARFITIDDAMIAALPPDLRRKVGGELQANNEGSAEAGKTVALTHDEVNRLLSAMQSSKESTLVTAPRLTLFNGQHAYISVTRQHSYTADFTMTKTAAGETRDYEPRLATIDAGIVFDVSATLSSNRKSVTLTLHPTLTTLLGEDSVPYQGAPNEKLVVQKPKVQVSELNTMTSVPDGGTVVLGGLSADSALLGDSGKESSKPLLMLVNASVIQPTVAGK